MAAMHWAFMDHGDNDAAANLKIESIIRAKCPRCVNPLGIAPHGSINSNWYGAQFCNGAVAIANRAALYNAVNVGDVLILPSAVMPMHTMVVVSKSSFLGYTYVYIRGFNNVGTLGTGGFLQYDNSDRDIDVARYWHGPANGNQTFGNTAGALLRVPYANYSANALAVRTNCQLVLGAGYNYIGP
jgi:hypothetical protein